LPLAACSQCSLTIAACCMQPMLANDCRLLLAANAR